MANPQPDKFTKVSNELLERVPTFKFNGTQLRIILIVWRYTYGFKRKEHDFSISFLSEATNIDIDRIKKELKTLINRKILTVISIPKGRTSRVLRFNKDYDSWLEGWEKTPKRRGVEKDPSEGVKKTPIEIGRGGEKDPQERKKIFKENIKESSDDVMEGIPYKQIIEYLNLKTNKKYTIKSKPTIGFINGRFSEGRTLEDFYHVIDVKVSHWLGDPKWDSYLRPSTLFNATNFENYMNQKINKNPNKPEMTKFQKNKELLLGGRGKTIHDIGRSEVHPIQSIGSLSEPD